MRWRSNSIRSRIRGCSCCLLLPVLCVAGAAGGVRAQGEAYYFATAGFDSGPASFVDTWCGPDMLPYTEDDMQLPERGNIGGTLGFSWIDADGDLELSDEERIFVVIRRGDDDMHTFSTRSYPQYGVIAEAEDWIDYHEARNRGPSASSLGDPNAEGNDFEHNDRAGAGETGWESASNYYWYNNYAANQRGWGGSKYYFEHRNGEGLDEIEGFNKWLSFQNNMDDPTTPGFDERGTCRNSYMRSAEAVVKGLLIPVEYISGLEDGELDPLFGWYEGDMAAYVRDVLGPRIEDDSPQVFLGSGGCAQSGLPPTHLMILQIECPIAIDGSGDCGDTAAAEAQAAYWGVEPLEPGQPETEAVYRVSHVLLFSDEMTDTLLGVPNWVMYPEDAVARNLWVQDDFWRDDAGRIGSYSLSGAWSIQPDTSFDRGCAEQDMLFQLGGGAPGWFEAPLAAVLDPAQGDVIAVAEVAYLETEAIPIPDPEVRKNGGPVYQLILLDGDAVVAYAELSSDGSSVNIGGALGADGLASGPASSAEGGPAEIPLITAGGSPFTRFILSAGPRQVDLIEVPDGEYVPNDYAYLDDGGILASWRGVVDSSSVTAVRLAASTSVGVLPAVDGFAVFSNLYPTVEVGDLIRGDTNNDSNVDLSDGIFLLQHLFVGGPRWVCEEGANINDDGTTDLSDAVYVFTYLYLGGPIVPPPYPECGPDPGGEICPESACNQ